MNLKGESGFSLTELAAIVLIVGVLIVIAIASYTFTISRAHSVTCETNRRTLNSMAQVYRADNDGRSINNISDLGPYIKGTYNVLKCPANPLISLSYNPTTGLIECAYHAE